MSPGLSWRMSLVVAGNETTRHLMSGSLNELAARPDADRGVSFLGDSPSYGRHTCKVTMEAGTVKAAQYSFAD